LCSQGEIHRVEDNKLARGTGDPSLRPVDPVRLTSPSYARRQRLLNEMYNVTGALHGYRAVKFDSCNNLSVHIVLVNILRCVIL